jgi:hypothetical protein
MATDPTGESASCTATVSVVDLAPPAIVCPGDTTVPAEDPTGAVFTHAASATDNCGVSSLTCSPGSGSIMPIGVTEVSCRASDASLNVERCSFFVTVLGPADQIGDLRDDVIALRLIGGLERSLLLAKLDQALMAFLAGDTASACRSLDTFIREVIALSGVHITTMEADDLIATANRIKAVIGC